MLPMKCACLLKRLERFACCRPQPASRTRTDTDQKDVFFNLPHQTRPKTSVHADNPNITATRIATRTATAMCPRGTYASVSQLTQTRCSFCILHLINSSARISQDLGNGGGRGVIVIPGRLVWCGFRSFKYIVHGYCEMPQPQVAYVSVRIYADVAIRKHEVRVLRHQTTNSIQLLL